MPGGVVAAAPRGPRRRIDPRADRGPGDQEAAARGRSRGGAPSIEILRAEGDRGAEPAPLGVETLRDQGRAAQIAGVPGPRREEAAGGVGGHVRRERDTESRRRCRRRAGSPRQGLPAKPSRRAWASRPLAALSDQTTMYPPAALAATRARG